MKQFNQKVKLSCLLVLSVVLFSRCAHDEAAKNRAKESAARYWQDKAYPGKAFDVQVIEAEKTDGGQYRVRGIVDGETRVGVFSPDAETFSEGYYSLSQERNKRIAELEQESKYWKEKAEGLEKENYKLKVQLQMIQPGSMPTAMPAVAAPAAVATPAPVSAPVAPSTPTLPKSE